MNIHPQTMDYYIYRNFTVENLFKGIDTICSGYGDISEVPDSARAFIWLYLPPIKMDKQEVISEITDFQQKFRLLFSQIPERKIFIAFKIISVFDITFENGNNELQQAIQDFNNLLVETARESRNLKVLDLAEFQTLVNQPLLDWKYYYISQSLITPKLNSTFKSWFLKKVDAINAKRKKCLVLDLDNTLWGGILGEDGIEGIKIGDTYPGLAFKDFQENILETAKNGIILAICSKNNEEDVLEVWAKHPFQLIKQQNISAYRINWQDKATNIQELADELNIGLDSFVFIDDNPIERDRIKKMLPMVTVPDFPEHPYMMSAFFKQVYNDNFQIHHLTNEDRSKTQQYTENAERKVFKKAFESVDEYLESLEMELGVIDANKFTISRIAQMTYKTNQFNLTTRRYEESDIQNFVAQNALVNCLSVKDKFGDNGITVASIITFENDSADIDSFLLSCRILGRGVETAYIDFLINKLYDKGIKTLTAHFILTQKNRQTEFFYEKNGFTLLRTSENGDKHYILNIQEKRQIKTYYKFKISNNDD